MIPLLMLRHGPTDWSAGKRLQGRADRPLSEAGIAAVRRWRLPPESADWACVASPLRRALDTARLLGRDAAPEPALIEMDWGAWEGRRLDELRAELGAAMAAEEARGLDMTPPGGESPRMVQARLRPWLAGLDRPLVAVAHKGVLRALYALATGWDMAGDPPDKLRDGRAHLFGVAGGAVRAVRLNIALEDGA
ncbi:MAG TPA: histidine phosphatase family protein [Alphaproteobacteria bacterium]|nr:histidine phosphatase family protein [Alphaproteobacteria bacterium]